MPTTTKKTPSRKDLPLAELLLSEVFQKVSNAKTKAEKIKLLQRYNSQALRTCLIWNFDDSIYSNVPEGDVPYTPNDAPIGTDHTRLWNEYKGLYRFVKGGADKLQRTRRENLFIQLLENLHPDEAEIVVLIKDGGLQNKYRVTRAVVEEAFPEITWGKRDTYPRQGQRPQQQQQQRRAPEQPQVPYYPEG